MLFSSKQLDYLSEKENEEFVGKIIVEMNERYKNKIREENTLTERLVEAKMYADSLDINDEGLLRSWLYLEACNPGFSSSEKIRVVLEKAEDAEQRYRDIINGAIKMAEEN
ncbi:hypothetical protein [Lonsdalea quercina]|uniref:hypothetical protein n=1 Tax=Lonsdalea quercina TaxID=71657 RepID=UPI003976FE94